MTATWSILVHIADRLEADHPAEAMRLRFCASDVQYLEARVNELVADEIAAQQVVDLRKWRTNNA